MEQVPEQALVLGMEQALVLVQEMELVKALEPESEPGLELRKLLLLHLLGQ